jgi:hypothetical protein
MGLVDNIQRSPVDVEPSYKLPALLDVKSTLNNSKLDTNSMIVSQITQTMRAELNNPQREFYLCLLIFLSLIDIVL